MSTTLVKPQTKKEEREEKGGIIITRKIQLNFLIDDKSELKELYKKIYGWQKICQRAANLVATHLYTQDSIKDLFYLTDETKVKLANVVKDPNGILLTSRDNTTYQLLSRLFKGQAPMGMLSGLNTVLAKTYKEEIVDVKFGKKSLRSYRNNIPMPVRKADISNWVKHEDGNYSFHVYGTKFKTYFGRDLSGNEIITDRAMRGEYKLCDSSIQLDGGKMFLLAVFRFQKEEIQLDVDKTAICHLSPDHPIMIEAGNDKFFKIGNKEEYLHRRIAIRGALHRLQKALKFSGGGKGRKRNLLKALERYQLAEKSYINTKMHQYSSELIKYCIERKIANIVLSNFEEVKEEGKTPVGEDTNEPLLRSWSFSNLAQKIVYKAAKVGIVVELK